MYPLKAVYFYIGLILPLIKCQNWLSNYLFCIWNLKKKKKKHLFLVGSALLVGAKLGFFSDWFGHSGSPEGPHTILWQQCGFFTRTRAAGFMRARQTDPLDAIKPSTSEQRGQVLGASLRAHLHPAGEKTAPSQWEALYSPIPTHRGQMDDGGSLQADAGA